MSPIYLIYLIIFVGFFGNSLEGYGLLPPVINWMTEPLIYLLFLISIPAKRDNKVQLPFLWLILYFFLVAFLSMLLNKRFGLEPIFSLRILVRFIIFFWALTNLHLQDFQIKKINNFLIFIFLLQIPVATIKFIVYEQGERATGTYSLTSGAVSTMLPLIAIGYLIAFYLYYKNDKKYFLMSLGFIYFGIIGGKRALVYMLPVLMIFMAFMLFKERRNDLEKYLLFKKRLRVIASLLVIITAVASIKTMASLNPEGRRGGSFSIVYLFDKFVEYTNLTNQQDPRYTAGRFATTKQVVKVLCNKDLSTFLFGYGPGVATRSRFSSEGNKVIIIRDIYIQYGVTAFVFIALEYGFLGAFIYFFFLLGLFFKCVKYWKKEREPYWQAYAFGSVAFSFTMLLLFGYYGKNSMLGDTIPLLYYYCMSIIIIKLNRIHQLESRTITT